MRASAPSTPEDTRPKEQEFTRLPSVPFGRLSDGQPGKYTESSIVESRTPLGRLRCGALLPKALSSEVSTTNFRGALQALAGFPVGRRPSAAPQGENHLSPGSPGRWDPGLSRGGRRAAPTPGQGAVNGSRWETALAAPAQVDRADGYAPGSPRSALAE